MIPDLDSYIDISDLNSGSHRQLSGLAVLTGPGGGEYALMWVVCKTKQMRARAEFQCLPTGYLVPTGS